MFLILKFVIFSTQTPFYIENYCDSEYKETKQLDNSTLNRVILIHRHGDRTATRLAIGDANEKKTCLNCLVKNISYPLKQFVKCKVKSCSPGDLTEKGFKQLMFLGETIFKKYEDLLKTIKKESDIFFRSTNIPRTKTSLNALLEGLIKNIKNKKLINIIKGKTITIPKIENDSLMRTSKRCRTADHLLDKLIMSNNNNIPNNIDNVVVKMCNRENIENMKNEIGEYFQSWGRIMKTISQNILLIKRDFGRFSDELINLLNGPKFSIISAHDTTLATILSGLKCNMNSHPPYASYIAIEEYEVNKDQYVRILFNGNILNSAIFRNNKTLLKKTDLVKYLKFIRVNDKDFKKICN